MAKYRTLFILGLFVAILPYLGFPEFWRRILFIILGLAVSYISYLLYKEKRKSLPVAQGKTDTYADSR